MNELSVILHIDLAFTVTMVTENGCKNRLKYKYFILDQILKV